MQKPSADFCLRASLVVLLILLAAAPVLAAEKKQDYWGGVAILIVCAVVFPSVQFLTGILLPRYTRRTQRAIQDGFLPCAGWGALTALLAIIVSVILGQGGEAGKGLTVVVIVTIVLLALTGGAGTAKCIGDWALRRWGITSEGPFNVLCGAVVWTAGAILPIFGWIAGLFSLFANLGAAIQVILQPHAFDPEADSDEIISNEPPPP